MLIRKVFLDKFIITTYRRYFSVIKKICKYFFYTVLIICLFSLVCYGEYVRYLNVKKHFPDMTYNEYLYLQDKIRITPKDNSNPDA